MTGKGSFAVTLFVLFAAGMGFCVGWFLREPPNIAAPAAVEEIDQPTPSESGKEEQKKAEVVIVRPTPPVSSTVPEPEIPGIEKIYQAWSRSPQLAGALVGFCVFDDAGELIYGSPLAETALCPASALKTVTTGAAFGLLGPEFRFRTHLLGEGPMREGRLAGDLVLKGSGDPTLSREDLEQLAGDLVKRGLKRVDGTLRVDASVFSEVPVSEHWNWGDIGNAYGTGAFGVNVGHNVLLMSFDPGMTEGDPAKFAGSEPFLAKTRWDTNVKTGPAGSGDRVMIYSSPYSDVIQATGTVPLGERGFTVRASLPNPPALAGSILRAALERQGVIFSGKKSGTAPGEVILTHDSPPLPEIVDHLHEVSDNLEAQCLFLAMGNMSADAPERVVESYWSKAGVSFTGLRLIDGSGLARANMIRPVDLARVNFAASRGRAGDRFLESLPSSWDGALRSKRGAMSGVRTEVGFVIRGGKKYPFALMANGLGSDVDFWRLRGLLLDAIGR